MPDPATIYRRNFVYSADGHGYCVVCVTGETDTPLTDEDQCYTPYTPVPEADVCLMVCENCGAKGAE